MVPTSFLRLHPRQKVRSLTGRVGGRKLNSGGSNPGALTAGRARLPLLHEHIYGSIWLHFPKSAREGTHSCHLRPFLNFPDGGGVRRPRRGWCGGFPGEVGPSRTTHLCQTIHLGWLEPSPYGQCNGKGYAPRHNLHNF